MREYKMKDYTLKEFPMNLEAGKIYKNNDGSVYRVVRILTTLHTKPNGHTDFIPNGEIEFERVSDRYRLTAVGTRAFEKTYNDSRVEHVIEWDRSKHGYFAS
jgi:hypothetical protein